MKIIFLRAIICKLKPAKHYLSIMLFPVCMQKKWLLMTFGTTLVTSTD